MKRTVMPPVIQDVYANIYGLKPETREAAKPKQMSVPMQPVKGTVPIVQPTPIAPTKK